MVRAVCATWSPQRQVHAFGDWILQGGVEFAQQVPGQTRMSGDEQY